MKAALEGFLGRAYPEKGAPGREPSTGALAVQVAVPAPAPAPVPASGVRPAGVAGTFEAPPVRKRPRLLSFALAAVAVAVVAFFIRTSGRVAPTSAETPPVPEDRLRIPTPASPTTMGTATVAPQPAAVASSASAVAEEPAPMKPVPASARREAARQAAPTPPAEMRRAKYPPDFEELPVPTVPGELATTCAGKTVGLSLTVAEDGSLASAKVISPSGVSACDDVALAAVRRARYRPAMAADGKPVEGRFAVSVPF
jgi:TonB family protein